MRRLCARWTRWIIGVGLLGGELAPHSGGETLPDLNVIGSVMVGGSLAVAGSVTGRQFVGSQNSALGDPSASAMGGRCNLAAGTAATVCGGQFNVARGEAATVAGGTGNVATGLAATVIGGRNNRAAMYAVVGGGYSNAAEIAAVIGGGLYNRAAAYTTVGGGHKNEALGSLDVIAGGDSNRTAGSQCVFIGAGRGNEINAAGYAFLGGGEDNAVGAGKWSVLAGGAHNDIYMPRGAANGSVIGGGIGHTLAASYAVIPGGYGNTVRGDYALAAGRFALAAHPGSLVWADASSTNAYASRGTNTVSLRAAGGFWLEGGPIHGDGSGLLNLPSGMGRDEADARYVNTAGDTLAGSLSVQGSLQVDGALTATSIAGAGQGVTGVDAATFDRGHDWASVTQAIDLALLNVAPRGGLSMGCYTNR